MSRPWRLCPLLAVLFLYSAAFSQEALIDIDSGTSMFTDIKAHHVGDIITILIRESTVANSSASTDTEVKASAVGPEGDGPLGFLPMFGFSANNKYEGDGATDRQGQIKTEITATIVEILPNGNFRIEGKREMQINGEQETVSLSGVIRAKDITALNQVRSTQIADASITYEGKGSVNTAQRPGWITRIINWVF